MLCLDTLIVLCDLDVTKDQFRKFVYKELNIYFRSDFQTCFLQRRFQHVGNVTVFPNYHVII